MTPARPFPAPALLAASLTALCFSAPACTPIPDLEVRQLPTDCELPADCGEGRTCGNAHGAYVCCAADKRCCARDQDCADGYACDTEKAECAESCGPDEDRLCQAGFHCFSGDQTCRPETDGSPCDVDSECKSERCAARASDGNRVCAAKLGLAAACARDVDCISGACSNGVCCGPGQVCCTESGQCPGGYACSTNTSVCYGDCNTDNDSLCQAGQHCYAGVQPNRCQSAEDGQRCDVDTECASSFCRKSDDRCVSSVKLVDATPRAYGGFASSLALDGHRIAVGSTLFSDPVADRGSVVIFEEVGGRWEGKQEVLASDPQPGDFFGGAVALSGNVLAVGANQSSEGSVDKGKVYIFERGEASVWTEKQRLLSSGGIGLRFGQAVAVSGRFLAVGRPGPFDGASNPGRVSFYERTSVGQWVSEGFASERDAFFLGESLAMDGTTVVAGAPRDLRVTENVGAAYVYARTGSGLWEKKAKLQATDATSPSDFGKSVAIDGGLIVVGAPTMRTNGLSTVGAAYVFERGSDGVWGQIQKLLPNDPDPNQRFGASVAVSGTRVVVGAKGDSTGLRSAGAVYIYARQADGRFGLVQKVGEPTPVADAAFGADVAAAGERTWVTAPFTDVPPEQRTGAVYVF